MKKLFDSIYKLLPVISIVLYCIITISIIFSLGTIIREDEAHAWTIAGNTNLLELIDLMKVEGHFLIWYLIIKPFAKFNLLYPYSMYFINFAFMLAAIILLWKKAPFNNITKFLITFSSPIINVYSTQARCYGVGIFLMFLVLCCYNDRFKHPFRYIILLALVLNTSMAAGIAAITLGIMFIFDLVVLYKQKNQNSSLVEFRKLVLFIIGLLALNLGLLYAQFHGVQMPSYERTTIIKAPYYVSAYLGLKHHLPIATLIKTILLYIGTIVLPIALFKNKHALFFFAFSEITTLMFFTFVYEGRVHHICMMFIFAIMAFWILKLEKESFSQKYFSSIIISILALFMVFVNIKHEPPELVDILTQILNDKNLMQAKVFTNIYPISISPILPVINARNKTLYDLDGVDLSSYTALKEYFSDSQKIVSTNSFISKIDSEKDNYIIIYGHFADKYIKSSEYKVEISLYKTLQFKDKKNNFCIYKVEKIEKLKNAKST